MAETRSRNTLPSASTSARPSAPIKTPSVTQQPMPSYFSSTPMSERLPTPLDKQPPYPQSPSPNYFGFQSSNDTNAFLNDSPHHAQGNWSPPSSAVRSTAAASPSVMPADSNSDFDKFRRQSGGKTFNLGGLGGNFKMTAPPAGKPKQGRTANKTSPTEVASKAGTAPREMPSLPSRGSSNSSLLDPSMAELSRSPKRVLSPGSVAALEPVRKGSPATFANGDQIANHARSASQQHTRFQLPLDNIAGPMGKPAKAQTISTLSPSESDPLMVTPQHVVSLMQSNPEDILLLDLRVSTQYATSHISGALNLCIPTTLLKRPSFNAQKLAETFKDDEKRSRFERWRSSSYIIVYDASSTQMKDAQICLNTIKKFQGEGYEGSLHIIQGGFLGFNKSFHGYTDAGMDCAASASQEWGGGSEGPEIAPVIGGCPIPSSDQPANPFFGNIRQNMDLIGGVGQIALQHPQQESGRKEKQYPTWLQKAADAKDQGKKVSNKFEAIERREKKRMEDALSGKVCYGASPSQAQQTNQDHNGVQIAGIEKGTKNRYNNIWPFEHSRVKLQGVPKAGCDYFNASFVKASWSNKRYISTQAPIPATINDFWSVVWQQDVRVIVMLTAEKEGAQVKAHNYWDKKQYGSLHLDFLSEKRASLEPGRIHRAQQKRPGSVQRTQTSSAHPQIPLAPLDSVRDKPDSAAAEEEQPYVVVRKFLLRDERAPFAPVREITQLQYSSWPDFGAPAHPAHLLGLVEQTDAVVRATNQSRAGKEPETESERPILVHCSAGCGRTGTFCTVDSIIDMLKRQRLSKQEESHGQGRGQTTATTTTTPMEIDSKSPPPAARSPAGQHSKHDSKIDNTTNSKGSAFHINSSTKINDNAAAADDFFNSQYQPSAHADQGIDGPWLHGEDVDLVEKTVEDFRHQRISMVQSLRQYVLCYESVMEWVAEQGEMCG